MQLRTQKGFTLIEIAIVLTIVGLIIGGIWLAASTVFQNNKAQTFAGQLVQVIQNAKTSFQGGGTTPASGLSVASGQAANLGWFPQSMQVCTAATKSAPASCFITTPFVSGAVTKDHVAIGPGTITASGDSVQIQFGSDANGDDMTVAACGAAASILASPQNVASLGVNKINGTAVSGLSQAQAAATCSSTAPTLTVVFAVP